MKKTLIILSTVILSISGCSSNKNPLDVDSRNNSSNITEVKTENDTMSNKDGEGATENTTENKITAASAPSKIKQAANQTILKLHSDEEHGKEFGEAISSILNKYGSFELSYDFDNNRIVMRIDSNSAWETGVVQGIDLDEFTDTFNAEIYTYFTDLSALKKIRIHIKKGEADAVGVLTTDGVFGSYPAMPDKGLHKKGDEYFEELYQKCVDLMVDY